MTARTISDIPLGAHMSIAGGLHLALARGIKAGCRVVQIFTRNSNQWKAKPLDPAAIERFHREREASGLLSVFAHDGYLINLASSHPVIREKSLDALGDELERASALGLPYLVVHPGAHKGDGERDGLRRIAQGLDQVFRRHPASGVQVLLETTAGQGTSLGFRFEHLAEIMTAVGQGERLGVCLDTCHIFAAGYDIRTAGAYERTMGELERTVGRRHVKVIHVNDCKKDLGSRIDRHEHIGKGRIGLEGFRCLMRDERLKHIPKVLETPKGPDLAEDRENLTVLRRLAHKRPRDG
jgi:deoxyribonuclease-4